MSGRFFSCCFSEFSSWSVISRAAHVLLDQCGNIDGMIEMRITLMNTLLSEQYPFIIQLLVKV